MQVFLEVDELLHLALEQLRYGNACPTAHDLCNVLLVDLLLEHSHVRLEVVECRLLLNELLHERGERCVAQLCRLLKISVTLRLFRFGAYVLCLLLDVAYRCDCFLLQLPVGRKAVEFFLEVCQFLLDDGEALCRCSVLLLRQCLTLDLELAAASFEIVDLVWHRVDLDTEFRSGLVDEVDRLVRELPAGDVPV